MKVDLNADPATLWRVGEELIRAAASSALAAKFARIPDEPELTPVDRDPWMSLDAIRAPSSGPRASQEEFEREVRTGRALAQIEMALEQEQHEAEQAKEEQRATFRNTSAIGSIMRF
jgi:hypothetical protein